MIKCLIEQDHYSRGDNAKRIDMLKVEFVAGANETLGGRKGVALVMESGEEILLSLTALEHIVAFAKEAPDGFGLIVKFSPRDESLIDGSCTRF